MVILENIDIDIDIDKAIPKISISIWWFWKISISIRQFFKISISIKYRIDSNVAYRTGLDQADVGNLTLCSFSGNNPNYTSCFNSTENITQKLRVCDGNEWTLQISIFFTLVITNSLSLAASIQLNRITNYVTLYKVTKSFLWHSVQQSFAKRWLPSNFFKS